MVFKHGYFQLFEQFVKFIEDNNWYLKKISGDCHSSLGIKLISIFSDDEKCMNDVKEYVEDFSKNLELDDEGYFDLTKLEHIDKDNLLLWFSKFIFDNGKTVGKGEVLLSILFNNVFKTPLGENSKETGDLFISNDGGKTVNGRIEVKSALPGGLKFIDMIKDPSRLEQVNDGKKLAKVYRKFVENPLGNSLVDKDVFTKLCAYCIAKYMHGQFPKEENYWLVIFDNQPHINSRGNIHDTESTKIKRLINNNGEVLDLQQSVKDIFGDTGDDFPFGDNHYEVPEETILSDGPTESTNGSEDVMVKNIDGFLYIKRCKTLNETMERILGLIDRKSAIYKENKSNARNNFTFYVKDGKIRIAHRDNPSIVDKKKTKKEKH